MKPEWALTFHAFSGDHAANDLANQLRLLQSLATLRPGIELTWRLDAATHDRDVNSTLELICSTDPAAGPFGSAVDELEYYASVAMARGYSFSRNGAPKALKAGRRTRYVVPSTQTQSLPLKLDWAILIDLLRHRGVGPRVELTAMPARPGVDPAIIRTRDVLSSTSLDTEFDAGLPYLASLDVPQDRGMLLELRLAVSSIGEVDDLVLHLIGHTVLGVPVAIKRGAQLKLSDRVGYTPEMALRAWHAPYGRYKGKGLKSKPIVLSADRDLSRADGVRLGTISVEGPDWDRPSDLRIAEEERLRHVYIVGKTGAGKTNLLKQIAEQDIAAGYGVAVITPHADLIDHLIATVGERVDDVVYLDFGDPEYTPLMNPLTFDIATDTDFDLRAGEIVDLLSHRTFNQWTGPVFADIARVAFATSRALAPKFLPYPSMAAAVELVKSDKLQRWAHSTLSDPSTQSLVDSWGRLFDSRNDRADVLRWVSAKFDDLGENSPLRAITTQFADSPLSIRDLYRTNQILLVRVPETYLQSQSAEFIGSLVFNRIYAEAQRAGLGDRKPFYVHVDEFQRFITSDIEELVAEARKFNLGLAFAHQNLRQLEAFSRYEGSSNPRLAEAIFSNVGTMLVMKTAGRDVETFATEMGVNERVVRSLVRGHAVVRTASDGDDVVCTMRTPLASAEPRPDLRDRVRERMITEGFWRLRSQQLEDSASMLANLRAEAEKPGFAKRAERAKESSDNAPMPSVVQPAGGGFVDELSDRLVAHRRRRTRADPADPHAGETVTGAVLGGDRS